MRQTSVEALIKVAPKIPGYKEVILEYIFRGGEYGATDQEIENGLGIPGNTVRPTRMSLLKAGKIVDSGTTRLNKNGNRCIVWVINNLKQGELF